MSLQIDRSTGFELLVCVAILAASLCASCAYADVPASERATLIALYTNAGGASWTHSAHWNTSDPVCPGIPANNWYGITCDGSNSTVTGIGLNSNNLSGTLAALSGLPDIQSFDVSFNGLQGSLPALTGLGSLDYFNVNFNSLTGQIPALSGLNNLRQFLAERNELTGNIPSLQGLTNLQAFEVDRNFLSGKIPSLAGLTSLTYLSVFFNQLSGAFPDLTGLSHFNALLLDNNRFSGTIPANALAGQSQLFYFDIDYNGFSGAPPTAPTTLTAGQSSLCPNPLDHDVSPGWDAAAGFTPWYTACTTTATTTTFEAPSVVPNPPAAGATFTVYFGVDVGSSATPTGTVLISDSVDNDATCTGTLSHVAGGNFANCSLSLASAGPHTLSAAYAGDGAFAPSSATFDLSVTGAASSTTLTATPNPATTGQSVVASATVVSPLAGFGGPVVPPSGSVVIGDGTTNCTATLAGTSAGHSMGNCALHFSTAGTHALAAAYSGDTVYNPSNATFDETVTAAVVVATPLPTLGGWGVLALVAALCGSAVYYDERRRKHTAQRQAT